MTVRRFVLLGQLWPWGLLALALYAVSVLLVALTTWDYASSPWRHHLQVGSAVAFLALEVLGSSLASWRSRRRPLFVALALGVGTLLATVTGLWPLLALSQLFLGLAWALSLWSLTGTTVTA
jgi:hypothetical protein